MGTETSSIDRTTPGRAMVRIGADRPFPVQVAWSGGAGARIESVEVEPAAPTHRATGFSIR